MSDTTFGSLFLSTAATPPTLVRINLNSGQNKGNLKLPLLEKNSGNPLFLMGDRYDFSTAATD
ncbi:MAG: hypothetical protein KJ930_07975, partial [Gammaproteobacteria bacterium]|nr:hypothetical protein [Gammaproteobacteria bacterium]